MSMENNSTSAEEALRAAIEKNWRVLLVQGILMLIAGIVAIMLPAMASLAVGIMVGWLFLIGGIIRIVSLFSMKDSSGFWLALLMGALMVLLGGYLAFNPAASVMTLTIVMVAFFIASGIASVIFAFTYKAFTGHWLWMIIGGIIDLILAGIIISGWPGTALWALGLIVGVNFVWTGISLIGVANSVKPNQAST